MNSPPLALCTFKMEFLKNISERAESLLEQVDQKTAEISKDVRSGNRAARLVAERIEKRERTIVNEGDLEAMQRQFEKMQSDLDAAGEVLNRSQQLAAEREAKLNNLLANERLEREKREDELLARIKELINFEARCKELESFVETLEAELSEAKGSTNQDTIELLAQIETAKTDAENARAALATSIKDSSVRIEELERVNLELIRELSEVKNKDENSVASSFEVGASASVLENERRKFSSEMQELEDRLASSEDRRASLEIQLNTERVRADRLETELRKSTQILSEISEEHNKKIATLEQKIYLLKTEADDARARAETLRRSNEDNGKDALEKRLESLSAHLELKQRQIDTLRSEKSALEQRLNEPNLFQGLRNRGSTNAVGMGDDPNYKNKFVRLKIDPQNRNISRAVDVMDGLTLSAGALMRSQPIIRLSFLAYILLLHLWVFHIINWTSSTPLSSNSGISSSTQLLRGSSSNE